METTGEVRRARQKAARGRRQAFKDAHRGFPRPFIKALNAKHLWHETPNDSLNLLSLSTRPFDPSRQSQINLLLGSTSAVQPPVVPRFAPATVKADDQLAECLRGLPDITFRILSVPGTNPPRHVFPLHAAVAILRAMADALIGENSPRSPGAKRIQVQGMTVFRKHARSYARELRNHVSSAEELDTIATIINCEAAERILQAFLEIPPDSLSLLSRCDRPDCRGYFLRRSYTVQKTCPGCKGTTSPRFISPRSLDPR